LKKMCARRKLGDRKRVCVEHHVLKRVARHAYQAQKRGKDETEAR